MLIAVIVALMTLLLAVSGRVARYHRGSLAVLIIITAVQVSLFLVYMFTIEKPPLY